MRIILIEENDSVLLRFYTEPITTRELIDTFVCYYFRAFYLSIFCCLHANLLLAEKYSLIAQPHTFYHTEISFDEILKIKQKRKVEPAGSKKNFYVSSISQDWTTQI